MSIRQSNPSIDNFQFQVDSDGGASITSSVTSAGGSDTELNGDSQPQNVVSLVSANTSFNAVDYLIDSLYNSLDSVELDRSLVQQSQVSGEMNNASSEILRTIEELEAALREHIRKYEKLKRQIIPEIVSNINKSDRLAAKLTESMRRYYPVEFSKSQDKVLNRITEEDEDMYV